MSHTTKRTKNYFRVHEIKETFLSLSGTVYGYQSNNQCYCRDRDQNTCTSIHTCGDCDLNRSGECANSQNASPIAGVS